MNETPAWRPDVFAHRQAAVIARSRAVAAIRRHLDAAGFTEVDTPALQISGGMEAHLRPFETTLYAPHGQAMRRQLHTSPEFAMKKLLAAGVARPYQLCHVFRNREAGRTHSPEFTMLEWYRAGADYRVLIDDAARMIQAAARATGADSLVWQGNSADPDAPWQVLTVAEAFDRYVGLDLVALLKDRQGLAAAVTGLGLHHAADDRWDDLFFRIFLDRIEPHLGIGAPTALIDYPAEMAALARLQPEDPRWAERVEIYVAGLELANGFSELTDAAEQRRRYQAETALKQGLYGETLPMDADFLAAVDAMPEAAGMALGIDRLVMLLTGAERIGDVQWLPVV